MPPIPTDLRGPERSPPPRSRAWSITVITGRVLLVALLLVVMYDWIAVIIALGIAHDWGFFSLALTVFVAICSVYGIQLARGRTGTASRPRSGQPRP